MLRLNVRAAWVVAWVLCGNATAGEAQRPAVGAFGIEVGAMDTTVKPGEDFYRYVNGKWLDTYKMPPDKARFGVFDELRDRAEADVKDLIEGLGVKEIAPGSSEQLVVDLYMSWMDASAIEERGITPLDPHLNEIAAIRSRADLMRLFGNRVHAAPFEVSIRTDPTDPTRYAVWISQGGLGMPNRSYYLKTGARQDEYRMAYMAYVTRLFELIGDDDPHKSAMAVVTLEIAIAKVQWTPEQRRIVKDAVNPMTFAELAKLAPEIDWPTVFAGMRLDAVKNVIVAETTAIRETGKLITSLPIDHWKKYLTFHLVSDNAEFLPQAFDEAKFSFESKALRGVEAQRERWKRGVGLVNRFVGEGISPLYVERHFPAQNKAKMDEMVANLRSALAMRLKTLPWMDDATRAEAQKKLATFEPRIGYPSKWRDYSSLIIERGKLFESVLRARDFEWRQRLERLHEPVDREEWGMTAQTVNAYYDSKMNQITFPAAILQPPFFDASADSAVNYGAIGAVIGHEIGHGFDDQGREFDETGKIRNWWSEATNSKFVAATDRLAAQYETYCPLPDACVNGRLTMGENIGDLGGLQMAYTAYQLSLGGKEAPVIDGFTGDQRFFMSWAQVWRAKLRDDALRNQLLTDPHSPPMVRGNAPVRNIDAWYDAFGVNEDDAMYLPPAERVKIW